MNNDFTPATHTQVREVLLEMQKYGGSMIQPLALYQAFAVAMAVSDDSITKMSKTRIRDISATFCALCNEFYLIYCFDDKPRTEFYMTEERWAKYFLGQKAIENSIQFLQRYSLIRYVKMKNPHKAINKVRVFAINLRLLKSYCTLAKEIHEKTHTDVNELLDKFHELTHARA